MAWYIVLPCHLLPCLCPQARVLIQAGASLSIKDRWGYNPLDVAHKVSRHAAHAIGSAGAVCFVVLLVPLWAAGSRAQLAEPTSKQFCPHHAAF